MQTVRAIEALRRAVAGWRRAGERVALVPTMGALHPGHMALVDAARATAERVVVSIFVNPAQFGPGEDLDAYPRREQADSRLLRAAGVDLLWMPAVETMYPPGFVTRVTVGQLGDPFEGAARPGHFDGVATVVAKLFTQVQPDSAVFGEKDWQQLMVIKRMAADLDLAVDIQAVPTQRDEDGLALSSRNAYLDEDERKAARSLPRALGEAARAIEAGEPVETALTEARSAIAQGGFDLVDYVALVDAATLAPVDALRAPARLLAAARIGRTRLLDNLPVAAPEAR